MRVRHFILVLLLLLAPAVRAAEWTVGIFDFYFLPTNITVSVGDTVTWINRVSRPHDTTYYDPNNPEVSLWASPLLGLNGTFSYTFTNAGPYPYVCAVHYFSRPWQTGLVTVAQANLPPSVSITNPLDGASFTPPASFTLSADATDSDGTVASVEFFVNGISAGISQGPVFSVNVSGLSAGTYSLTAVAIDNQGATRPSDAVSIFVATKYPLVATSQPQHGGSLTLDPPQPSDGYNSGTIVTLTARAANDFAFVGWSGDTNSTANPISVVMDAAKTIVANFASNVIATYTLTLATNPPAGGTIEAQPAPNGPNGTYLAGTMVTLTATPNAGFAFSNWFGTVSGTSNSITATMTTDHSQTADFVHAPIVAYQVVTGLSPLEGGAIATSPPPNGPEDGSYLDGTVVTFTAIPAPGFVFMHWSLEFTTPNTNNPLVLVIRSNTLLVASFVEVPPPPLVDFSAVSGPYAGLIFDEGETNFSTSGFLSIKVSSRATYRGVATLGGIREAVAGQFDRFGYAPLLLRRGTLSGSLQINQENGLINGLITDGVKSPTLLLYRKVATDNLAVPAGNYTMMMAVIPPMAEAGLMTMQISADGEVHMRGTLGDGTPLRLKSFVSADGRVPLYSPLYHRRGAMLGWLDVSPNGTGQGTMYWFRPPDSRNNDFPEGFAVTAPMNGIAESTQLRRRARFHFLKNDALCSPQSLAQPVSAK